MKRLTTYAEEKEILLNGVKVNRRNIIEASGRFEKVLLYNNKLYEIHIEFGHRYQVIQIEKKDKEILWNDPDEPRVNIGGLKHNWDQEYDELLV